MSITLLQFSKFLDISYGLHKQYISYDSTPPGSNKQQGNGSSQHSTTIILHILQVQYSQIHQLVFCFVFLWNQSPAVRWNPYPFGFLVLFCCCCFLMNMPQDAAKAMFWELAWRKYVDKIHLDRETGFIFGGGDEFSLSLHRMCTAFFFSSMTPFKV